MFGDKRLTGPETDLKEFVSELAAPWKTMTADMDTALTIITNHAKTEIELERLDLFSVSAEKNVLQIEFPDWQKEAEKIFVHQYGLMSGKLIFNKVLMRLFLISRGAAQQLH